VAALSGENPVEKSGISNVGCAVESDTSAMSEQPVRRPFRAPPAVAASGARLYPVDIVRVLPSWPSGQPLLGGRRREVLTDRRIRVPLIHLVIVLIVVGVLLWAVNTYIPMDGKIKSILNVVVVIAVVLWLLQAFGVLDSLSGIHIGR